LDIYFCPFLKNENTFTKKKYVKMKKKAETIKIFKVSSLKKVFQICDDKFFSEKLLKIFVLNLNSWDFYLFLV